MIGIASREIDLELLMVQNDKDNWAWDCSRKLYLKG